MSNLYPEARMTPAMKYWKLPQGKESRLAELCNNSEYFLEEKVDGYWYMFEKTANHSYLFSRNKSVQTKELTEKSGNVPHIIAAFNCLPPNTTLIGEIYYPGKTSKDVTTIMGCLADEAIKRQENNPIHYYVHDMIMYDGISLIDRGAEERYDLLAAIWRLHNLDIFKYLRLAVKITDNLEEEIRHILESGGEGVVLKKKDYPYVPDKRPAWSTIKVKQEDSIDLVCCGFCSPTKEYTGKDLETWPYWVTECLDLSLNDWIEVKRSNTGRLPVIKDIRYRTIPVTKYYYLGWNTAIKVGAYDRQTEKLFELGTVSSGLTDEDRQLMTERPQDYLGKVVSLKCMSLDKKEKTLRHPALICWRDDKSAQDCWIDEVFK